MPESIQPFAASQDPSNLDITHNDAIDDDDLTALTSEEIADVQLQFADDDAPPTSFEPPEAPLPVAPVALARVSFSEQATLSFDGYQETFQVTLLNLSTQGVACLGPHGLNVADTVRLTFALAAGEKPANLLCEVMWSQPSTPREDAYGLRFTAVEDRLLAQVEDVVRQRCDSAAAACQVEGVQAPTIMATSVNSRPPSRPSMAPWVVAAAGAAAGMLVTLAVMVLAESDMFAGAAEPMPTSASANLAGAEAMARAPLVPLTDAVAARVDAPSANAAMQTPPAVVGLPAPSQPAAPQKDVKAASVGPHQAGAEAAPAAAEPAKVDAPPDKAAVEPAKVRFVGALQVEETAQTVALTLRTNGPTALHEEFWLKQPTRLVVDIPAARNGMQGHTFEVDNALVARVRVGDHADKVRFVIETKNASSVVRAKASGDALRIELQQRPQQRS